MKRAFVILCLLISVTAGAQQRTAAPDAPRFQLFAATVDWGTEGKTQQILFRLDTATGQVWMFLDKPTSDNKIWLMGWTKVPELPSHPNPAIPEVVPPPLKQ